MSKKPVFVFVTADNCGYCSIFKERIWTELKNKLVSENRVDIVEINLPTTGSKPDIINYPKDLRRFIGWFPTLILFPASSWYNNIGTRQPTVLDGH